jgi:hypothetical protein
MRWLQSIPIDLGAVKFAELVAQRMVRDLNALGHRAYLITSVYHDGAEVIQATSLRKGKGYVKA